MKRLSGGIPRSRGTRACKCVYLHTMCLQHGTLLDPLGDVHGLQGSLCGEWSGFGLFATLRGVLY